MLDESNRFIGQEGVAMAELRMQKGPPPDESGPELAREALPTPDLAVNSRVLIAELLRIIIGATARRAGREGAVF